MHVSPDEKVRSAAKAIEKELTAFGAESSMRRDKFMWFTKRHLRNIKTIIHFQRRKRDSWRKLCSRMREMA